MEGEGKIGKEGKKREDTSERKRGPLDHVSVPRALAVNRLSQAHFACKAGGFATGYEAFKRHKQYWSRGEGRVWCTVG